MEATADLDTHISLPEFEGPLDLLLHLVKKHELPILDIPIAFITDQYLRMIETMRQLNMDIAGEYLVMAATLMHIKSRELLPRAAQPEDRDGTTDEEDIDPRQALIRRLLEYQKYKAAAEELGGRPVIGRNVWTRGGSTLDAVSGSIDLTAPLMEVPVWGLIEALEKVLGRARVPLNHDVTFDRLSLADRINELSERLEREESFTFESCFAFVEKVDAVIGLRAQVVLTFMAILEMARLGLLRIYQVPISEQAQEGGSIYIARAGISQRAPRPDREDQEKEGENEPA